MATKIREWQIRETAMGIKIMIIIMDDGTTHIVTKEDLEKWLQPS
jgi:hypothetical protein